MRPLRLELTGFASYSRPTEVNFEDADLFVLTGPTGSGKSSLVDAITFALYGTVPRYDHKGMVAPVITQGKQEAKVRLDFQVGNREYTAVRVVRRLSSGGATTKEARLERGEETLAGSADELTQQVTSLLGLTFEHFVKCVVLPQGDFAQFLRDKPAKRQELLVKLLDIGIYRELARRARSRAARSRETAELTRRLLEQEYQHVTAAALEQSLRRLADLEELRQQVSLAQPRRKELERTLEADRSESKAVAERVNSLKRLRLPEGVVDLSDRLSQCQAADRQARQRREHWAREIEKWEEKQSRLPEKFQLQQLQQDHASARDLTGEIQGCESKLRQSREQLTEAQNEFAKASDDLETARRQRREAQDTHAAAHLAAHLEPGDRCPVCDRRIETVPSLETPPDLERVKERVRAAETVREKKRDRLTQSSSQVQSWAGLLEDKGRRLAEVEERLREQPSATETALLLRKALEADEALKKMRQEERRARKSEQSARERLENLKGSLSEARNRLHQARDSVTAMHPPAIDEGDLAAAWRTLLQWGRKELSKQQEKNSQLEGKIEATTREIRQLESQLHQACRDRGLAPEGRALEPLCAEAVAKAQARLARLQAEQKTVKKLKREAKALDEEARVAGALARLLGAQQFEKWYLNRAMQRLTRAASKTLRELSWDQYSLTLDKKGSDFMVVDHNNADELRLARTLSGGETFLASLSLALALSEDVAQLAAHGAARLDALFLDEGFGTLDPDTLDTVASVIEALGARGRMVGLITHVSELAERIPVCYRVTKDAATSRVEKVVR